MIILIVKDSIRPLKIKNKLMKNIPFKLLALGLLFAACDSLRNLSISSF